MKRIVGIIVAGLMIAGAGSLMAQNAPGGGRGQGKGYGGPPQSEEERAARQAGCAEKNGGICPNGGPRQDCPGLGQGQGQGRGQGYRNGARDGTGPRGGNGKGPARGKK